MTRNVKSRAQRKPKQNGVTNARESRAIEQIRIRRYLAFVRAIVGDPAKGRAR
ncbi:MAG: hypothetical protein ACM3JJ_05220 [Hyphomicrobiales bacterium]